MSFMQPQITGLQEWWEITNRQGESYIIEGGFEPEVDWALTNAVERRFGYGARLSAPGYMDCTEWAVFSSMQFAAAFLIETFYDKPDDEMTADEQAEFLDLLELAEQNKE